MTKVQFVNAYGAKLFTFRAYVELDLMWFLTPDFIVSVSVLPVKLTEYSTISKLRFRLLLKPDP
jgi:hypothetical protein